MFSDPITLTIDRLSYGPAGVGRSEGKVIFVPGTVPGDEIAVRLTEEKKTYALGRLIALHHPSPHRRQPPCPYVSRYGGCPWQQVTYAEQLRAKELLVREQLRRIGGIADPPLLPIIPSPQEWHYRHRIRLQVTNKSQLGFFRAGSHEVIEIETCLIAADNVEASLRAARSWVASLHTRMQSVELLWGESTPGTTAPQVVLLGKAEGKFVARDEEACLRFLRAHPEVAGCLLLGQGWRRAWGDPAISFAVNLTGKTLTVSQGAFTQVNLPANRVLIQELLHLSQIQPHQRVTELYCGVGNLSLPLAAQARELIGIEQDSSAVADAEENAARAGLTNVRFLCMAVLAGVRSVLHQGIRSDLVVLDPPRTGAADVIEAVARLQAPRVIYVSCDPTTLARDLRKLGGYGYRLSVLQPLDLFPQTYHVETIAVSVLT